MKVAPVSADLLIKLALGAAVLGALYYGYAKVRDGLAGPFKGIGDVFDSVTNTAGQVGRGVGLNFTQPLADRVSGYAENPPTAQDYFGKYQNPLINDDGVNFGLF